MSHLGDNIFFMKKLITGSEKIEPFDVLTMGNIIYFHLEHSNQHLFYLYIFQDPFKKFEKKSSDYRVHGTQNDRKEPWVSTQK